MCEGGGGGAGVGGVVLNKYRTNSTYSERQTWANRVDPDQMPQIRIHTVCYSPSNFIHIHMW